MSDCCGAEVVVVNDVCAETGAGCEVEICTACEGGSLMSAADLFPDMNESDEKKLLSILRELSHCDVINGRCVTKLTSDRFMVEGKKGYLNLWEAARYLKGRSR